MKYYFIIKDQRSTFAILRRAKNKFQRIKFEVLRRIAKQSVSLKAMISEQQFECLFRTPYEQRVLHIDATGNLVKVHGNVYKRILNYTFLVKNYSLRDIEESPFQLGEFISSNHDVMPLTIMIMRMKYQFEKFFSKQFNFRIFVCDFSWTLIHSAIESLNQISIIQYANLVMELANGK